MTELTDITFATSLSLTVAGVVYLYLLSPIPYYIFKVLIHRFKLSYQVSKVFICPHCSTFWGSLLFGCSFMEIVVNIIIIKLLCKYLNGQPLV